MVRSRILASMIGLCLIGVTVGIAGERASDTSSIETARAQLGGDGLARVLDLFIAWVGTVQHARTIADLVVPERVGASMNDELRAGNASRELRQLDRLDRFDASPKVSARIRHAVESRCWSQRAIDPDACHACAAGVLDDMEHRAIARQREFWWLIGISTAALALLLVAAARDAARAHGPSGTL